MHSGESGQQLLEETISIAIMHPLRSTILKCWKFEGLIKFLVKLMQLLGTISSEIGNRFWGQV